ncbi:MAG: TetR/AcrR family transcriptional regulator [Candidatus Thorarchaeota archaeon]
MPKVLDDEQIFRAVIQTIAERGYTGSTTKDLAAAAGVSEVTLFRKYGSKEKLVKASISFIIGQVDLKSAGQYTGDVHTDLIRMVKIYYDLANEYGDFFSVMIFELQRHLDLLEIVDEPFSIVLGFVELMARYQNEGLLAKEHPLIAWASLVSPILIVFNMKKVVPAFDMKIDHIRDHVTNYLSGRLMKPIKSSR